jgi:ubiquinone/menaquinone biosynthesis C-methylase UbiE
MENFALKRFYKTSSFYLEGLRQKDAQYFRHYVNLVRSQTNSDAMVLELGVGTGLSSYLLAQTGVKVISVDISLLFLRERIKNSSKRLRFCVADATDLPFKDVCFDTICSFDFVEHVSDVNALLLEMLRVLRPGGTVVIVSPNLCSPLNAVRAFLYELVLRVPITKRRVKIGLLIEAARRVLITFTKIGSKKPQFLYREIEVHDRMHSDMDACYLASPVDFRKYLLQRGCQMIRYQQDARTLIGRVIMRIFCAFAPSIYIVAKKSIN